jgi:hypothetical protein
VSALGLFVLLVILFRVWYDGPSALRGGALVVVTVLIAFMVATGWRLNYGSPAVDPRQPLVHAPAAEGLPDLVTTLKQLSSWRAGDPYLLNVIADRRVGPAVEWQLRRFKNVTWVDSLDQWPPTIPAGDSGAATDFEAIVTPADTTVKLDEGYAGQDFAVRAFWSPAGLHGQSLIRWIILRTATIPINYEKVVLWVKQD